MDMETMGTKFKTLRNMYGLSQKEVADFLGIDRSAYCCYEINRAKPDVYNLARLAKLFNVSTDYLLGLAEENEEAQLRVASNRIEYQADVPEKINSVANENFLTISPDERALILYYRLLPDRKNVLEEMRLKCVDYVIDDDSGFLNGLITAQNRKSASTSEK